MTKRLYYDQSDLLEFDSIVEAVTNPLADVAGEGARPAIILRESAFYPTSGGQVHDTGWITLASGERMRITEVADAEDGRVVHYLEAPVKPPVGEGSTDSLISGASVHGVVDPERRRDHMQQHTGQHVLSAAFIELYQFSTVSFHMGEDYCSIDLATDALSAAQVAGAEKRANEIVFENRSVRIRYVRREEAEKLGLRKLPPTARDELRLIEIADFDLSACGGTHVGMTGQIGSILLRKTEKTRQGIRVEFVCGARAVRVARRDYATLTEAAALYSAQLGDVPAMIRKSSEESKALRRQREDALEQLAQAMAEAALASGDGQKDASAPRVILRTFSDHDTTFAKLFAQKVTRAGVPAIALVGSTVQPAGLVFAQSAGVTADMGALLKQVLSSVGGRGGGSKDFAQGGVPAGCDVQQLLRQAASTIGSCSAKQRTS
ncbi:MAG: alanyl-tRNA editing protein [Terriglobales bacterium]|jgi:alanyl-tRNA synthetase